MGIRKAEGKKYFTNQGELNTTIIRKRYLGESLPAAEPAEPVDTPARPPCFARLSAPRRILCTFQYEGARIGRHRLLHPRRHEAV